MAGGEVELAYLFLVLGTYHLALVTPWMQRGVQQVWGRFKRLLS